MGESRRQKGYAIKRFRCNSGDCVANLHDGPAESVVFLELLEVCDSLSQVDTCT